MDLTLVLAVRDVKIRYQLSVLGIYWALINPMLMALVWGFVFNNMFKSQGVEGVPYLVFLFCGLTLWQLFSNSIMSSVNSLVGNATMLSKVSFERIILPSSSIIARFVDFIFSLLILIVLMVYYDISVTKEVLWLPLLLIVQLMFTAGLAYLFSAINVFFRDVSQIISVVLMLWMYISPVLYTVKQIPEDIRKYFSYNPIGQLIHMEVTAIFGKTGPNINDLLLTTSISIVTLFIGILIFKKLEGSFAEVM
ncbi:ABC transporter permease [Paenibacillus sp. GD4]|uniref:ABC transporter permease n=1 Tax=Paenibacillus sp. GD4 TaxID=3068890 RepID=UPI0027969A6C|nr:ABC transporter permease [Paenibacillus sp. GD4]MDQ1911632.1 ABC transporter permease [Paenibacillus sp. GD4]